MMLFMLLAYGTRTVHAAPNCGPWGNNSRGLPPQQRSRLRTAEGLTLRFLAVICFFQLLLGRCYGVEQPRGSDMFKSDESPMVV